MELCCEELDKFVEALDGEVLPVGNGEVSGSVELYKYTLIDRPMEMSFSDGWNSYPTLLFKYCPFCGTKQ